jgi:hypothetical protein
MLTTNLRADKSFGDGARLKLCGKTRGDDSRDSRTDPWAEFGKSAKVINCIFDRYNDLSICRFHSSITLRVLAVVPSSQSIVVVYWILAHRTSFSPWLRFPRSRLQSFALACSQPKVPPFRALTILAARRATIRAAGLACFNADPPAFRLLSETEQASPRLAWTDQACKSLGC